MSVLAPKSVNEIKSKIQFKPESRMDSFTDQFNRIFMANMVIIFSMLLSLVWLTDALTCAIPKTSEMDKGYVHQACWIQGYYIFKQLSQTDNDLRYYGLPNTLKDDGMKVDGTLCQVDEDENCMPMEKTFYLQYQWFPLYLAAIGFLFYLPHILFQYMNNDLFSLRNTLEDLIERKTKNPKEDFDTEVIVQSYFNYHINPPRRLRWRIVVNIVVKICYVLVNVVAFYVTDVLLDGDFRRYGSEWIAWSKGNNERTYDYTHSRQRLTPGEMLLPTFGICDVLELGIDMKHKLLNKHRFVCEISPNVLHQYVLILLWFFYIFGMLVSCVGFIIQIVCHRFTTSGFLAQGSQAKKVYQSLTLRECEYLEYVRTKNIPVYSKLLRKLNEKRLGKCGYDNVPNISDQPNNQSH